MTQEHSPQKLSVHGPHERLQNQAACWETCPLNPKAGQTGSPGLSVGAGDLMLQPALPQATLGVPSAGSPGHTQIPPCVGFLGSPFTFSLDSLGNVLSVSQICLPWQPGQQPTLLSASRPLSALCAPSCYSWVLSQLAWSWAWLCLSCSPLRLGALGFAEDRV